MPIRNPFARRPGLVVDENLRPQADVPTTPGFERVDTVGSKASSVLSIRSSKSQDNGEYKMSGKCSGIRPSPLASYSTPALGQSLGWLLPTINHTHTMTPLVDLSFTPPRTPRLPCLPPGLS
jgi:hypothetical protein